MGHYLINYLLTTAAMVVLLYAAYLYIKQSPQFGGVAHKSLKQGKGLKIKSVLTLEPRKNLYVVGYGEQRFLVATTMDKTELLTTLDPEPQEELVAEAGTETQGYLDEDVSQTLPSGAGFMDRFRCSLKMVFADRFSGLGGK